MTPTYDELVEVVARKLAAADGLDYDEVCGRDADPDLDECDSGTCVAAYSEDHDADDCRGWYRRSAKAAIEALRRAMVPVGWRYDHPEQGASAHVWRLSEESNGRRPKTGWTETPLYALPTPEDKPC